MFIQREKDKDKGKHQYVPVSFSNSTKCDYCLKSMANKDALQCQGKAVHSDIPFEILSLHVEDFLAKRGTIVPENFAIFYLKL